MKRLILLLAMLAAVTALSACQRVPKMGYTAPAVTANPASQSLRTYAPQKTASQDTAGVVTKLPEAATAAASPGGTLAP